MNVSRETRNQLDELSNIVLRWNRAINLISKADERHIYERHIADSIRVWNACDVSPVHWVDLGSGGGFPALVVACMSNGRFPITMIEADARKGAFLRSAIRQLGLKASILTDRIENVPPLFADVVSARALCDLSGLLEYADHHGQPATTCLFPKGAKYTDEINAAKQDWSFDLDVEPGNTDKQGVILRIRGLSRV